MQTYVMHSSAVTRSWLWTGGTRLGVRGSFFLATERNSNSNASTTTNPSKLCEYVCKLNLNAINCKTYSTLSSSSSSSSLSCDRKKDLTGLRCCRLCHMSIKRHTEIFMSLNVNLIANCYVCRPLYPSFPHLQREGVSLCVCNVIGVCECPLTAFAVLPVLPASQSIL